MHSRFIVLVGGILFATLVAMLVARRVSAQHAAADSLARPVACRGQTITRIEIHTWPPFDKTNGRTPELARRVIRLASQVHSTTRPSIVRRFLAMKEGEPCSELRRRESERILRAQPFLANAIVTIWPDTNGVIVDVATVDEVSLIANATFTSKSPMLNAIRLGEANVAGAGVYALGHWRDGGHYRDTYRGRLIDYQFGGRPYQLRVEGTRGTLGGDYLVHLSHPFFTDLQRLAWRMSHGEVRRFIQFRRRGEDPSLAFTRTFSDIGFVRGFGPPRRVFLGGISFTRERESTGGMPVIVSDTGLVPDTTSALTDRYGMHSSSRVNVLLGYRRVNFASVRGFDAVDGVQDIRRGIQLSGMVGRGIKFAKGDQRDFFMAGGAYYGVGGQQSFFGIETFAERRRNLDMHLWDGVLASGRAAWYLQPQEGRTTITSLEFGGGWRQRVPFQLTFADFEGGLRGYSGSDFGGSRRVVMRVEDRYRIGHFRNVASFAGAGFIDAGKLWVGDAPLGTNTGVKFSVGVSLLAAFPPASRRTWRVDLGVPVGRGAGTKVRLRFSSGDFTRVFWREPADVANGRERTIPNSVYNWP